jgi:hypothetical protein
MQPTPLRRDERLWLAGAFILTVCSWGRWLATGSVKIDENPPPPAAGYLLFTGVVLGWSLMILGWRGMLTTPVPNPRRLAYLGVAITAFMLPLLSNDVFSVLTYGSLAAKGHDVYTSAAALPLSPWYTWTGERWRDTICVYGPTTLLWTLPAGLAGSNPWIAIAVMRLTWLVPLVLVMELSFRTLRVPAFFHTMLWLNPLWVFEGPGQLHTDLLGVLAIVAGITAMQRSRPGTAWALWAVATLGKYSFAFAAPWFWLSGADDARQRGARIPKMAAVLVGFGALFFAPFWHGFKTITEPMKALAAMNPGGSFVYEAGEIVNVLRGSPSAPPGSTLTAAIAFDHDLKSGTWAIASLVTRIIALGVLLRVTQLLLKKARDPQVLATGAGAIIIVIITVASHRFLAWYLLAALPFFGMHCTPVWRRWWVAMIATSIITDFVFVIPSSGNGLANLCSIVGTAATLIIFAVSFRRRYFTFDEDVDASTEPSASPADGPPPHAALDQTLAR